MHATTCCKYNLRLRLEYWVQVQYLLCLFTNSHYTFLPPHKLSLLCITEFIYEFCIGPPLRNVNPLSPSLHALTQYMFEFYPTTVNNTNQLYNKSILFMLPSQLAQPSLSTPFKEMK